MVYWLKKKKKNSLLENACTSCSRKARLLLYSFKNLGFVNIRCSIQLFYIVLEVWECRIMGILFSKVGCALTWTPCEFQKCMITKYLERC